MKYLIFMFILSVYTAAHAEIPNFELRGKGPEDVLWRDAAVQIKRPRQGPLPKLGYAIIKAKPSAALQLLLPKEYGVAPLQQSLDMNYYMIPIDQAEQLTPLAKLAHASTGMCGSMEFVGLTSTVADMGPIYPPIYSALTVFEDMKTLLNSISLPAMDRTIDTLVALPSRFHRHAQGETAHTTVRQLWEANMQTGRWTITEVSQALSGQKSLIAHLPGLKFPDETLIIGAHLDSIISRSGDSTVGISPGADDDASGVAALTEILRIIESSHLSFDRSIELQAYAAEEVGLIGSRAIASSYAETGRKVAGMFQIDMAYFSEATANATIHLLRDFTSRDLLRHTIDLIRGYFGQVYKLGAMPRGAASDHKAFFDKGFPTVFPFEDPLGYNPHIHTGSDTRLQFDDGLLLKRITQLALLFTAHQGGLQSLAESYASLKKSILPENLRQSIKIALQAAEDRYYVAVAVPMASATVEFCQIAEGAIPHCLKERETLEKSRSLDQRKIFYSPSSWPLATGQKWRVLAYGENDELIAFRQFVLTLPTIPSAF